MRKVLTALFSRIGIFILSILLQIVILIALILSLSQHGIWVYLLFNLFSLWTILFVVAQQDNPIYKLAWVIPIALFPVYGWFLYLVIQRSSMTKKQKRLIREIQKESITHVCPDPDALDELTDIDPIAGKQVRYLSGCTGMSICKHTVTEYLTPGERFFARLCEELEQAEKFIFMEYFILENGVMWDTIREILERKAAQGVEVKLIYDEFGCLFTLPHHYCKELRANGIEAYVFNPLRPSPDAFMNHRDHRKITVIDGNIGFTGGNNLADEYINAYEKHGHWKDSSILLKGDAVWELSLLFLQTWKNLSHDDIDYDRYRPTKRYKSDGYVMAFGDSPLDKDLVGEICYMQIIEQAQRYVSITTPYLILDNEMITALCAAARSGVKVKIITPGIPDKWYVHLLTQYNYLPLLEAGVEIYEYTGGFIHAKTIVSDDRVAVVGSQNFDFRSFYLHFEVSALLFASNTVTVIRQDHLETIARSRSITMDECKSRKWYTRLLQILLNMFAPLM